MLFFSYICRSDQKSTIKGHMVRNPEMPKPEKYRIAEILD